MIVLRILGVAVLAFVAVAVAVVADAKWNDSRMFYFAMGRDALVSACTPPARDALAGKGFTPTDLAIGDRPSIGFLSGSLGRVRVLSAPFTFSDGPDGRRVDGAMVCTVQGKAVKVEVEVDTLPLRAA